jgi:N utilization substance protein A
MKNGKQCPNQAEPGSLYCSLPHHQALADAEPGAELPDDEGDDVTPEPTEATPVAETNGDAAGDDDGKQATVIVPDDQLSLAIGREGQNARLAARLTGWRIDIRSETEFATEEQEGGYEEEQESGRCAAILTSGRRCPNAALPGSRYCGLPAHQALEGTGSDHVGGEPAADEAVVEELEGPEEIEEITAEAEAEASEVEVAADDEAVGATASLEPQPEAAEPEGNVDAEEPTS